MNEVSNPLMRSLKHSRILIIEPETSLSSVLQYELQVRGAIVSCCQTGKDGIRKFHVFKPTVVICELKLPDQDGIELIKYWHKINPKLPIILCANESSVDSTISALRIGAFDYIPKPYELSQMISSVKRAAETATLRHKVENSSQNTKKRDVFAIIGSSTAIEQHRRLLEKIAKSKTDTTLLYGESGTGKELAAHAIHNWSHRKDEPYVEINCASIPETLLESELFGHERGAFTDARNRKVGLFELAGKGTVFLDEIGELPMNLQAKLLRVLETRRFRRLGGTQEVEVFAHITAATNKHLRGEVQKGNFRSDLYYRLSALPIQIPPLRERLSDIPELATYFVKIISNQLEIPRAEISLTAMDKLMQYDWPGNIRELKNVLQRSLVFHEPDLIEPKHIELDEAIPMPTEQKKLSNVQDWHQSGHQNNSSQYVFELPTNGVNLDQLERDLLNQALERSRYNQTKAARLLHISRHTLRYRLEKHNLLGKLEEDLHENES